MDTINDQVRENQMTTDRKVPDNVADKYQEFTRRTAPPNPPVILNGDNWNKDTLAESMGYISPSIKELEEGAKKGETLNYIAGLAGEAGELLDYFKKVIFHGHELDLVKLNKELGDIQWYTARLGDIHELNLSDIMHDNIEKLRQRYPDGFNTEDSIKRVDTSADVPTEPEGKPLPSAGE